MKLFSTSYRKVGIRLSLLLLAVLSFAWVQAVSASPTDGTIDPFAVGNREAWSNNAGWIDFGTGLGAGDIHITNAGVTGHAWSQNYGWINMNPAGAGVGIDGIGNLSGSAWGENTGFIDFAGVSIDTNGFFSGTATGAVVGIISFDCADCLVETDYRPQSVQGQARRSLATQEAFSAADDPEGSLKGSAPLLLLDVADRDGDGVLNVFDDDIDGDGLLNTEDDDIDGDGELNEEDTTPEGRGERGDADGDGIPDDRDLDVDADGVINVFDDDADGDGSTDEGKVGLGSPGDLDGDGVLNEEDADLDNDQIVNIFDADIDGDGIPNEEDSDRDGDGISNTADRNPDGAGPIDDIDQDGIPNEDDDDMDGDGIPNAEDLDWNGDGRRDDSSTRSSDQEGQVGATEGRKTPAALFSQCQPGEIENDVEIVQTYLEVLEGISEWADPEDADLLPQWRKLSRSYQKFFLQKRVVQFLGAQACSYVPFEYFKPEQKHLINMAETMKSMVMSFNFCFDPEELQYANRLDTERADASWWYGYALLMDPFFTEYFDEDYSVYHLVRGRATSDMITQFLKGYCLPKFLKEQQ